MPYWVYGAGAILLIVIIAALKADYGARVFITIAVLFGMAWFATSKKR